MSYTAPTIAASGTAFAQYLGGAEGHLDRIIAALAASPGLSNRQLELLRHVKAGEIDKVWAFYRQAQTTFAAGAPKPASECLSAVYDCNLVFAALSTLAAEAGALVFANEGHIVAGSTGIGGAQPVRTWP